MRFLRTIRVLTWFALLAFAGFLLWAYGRGRPQDVPWAPLDLSQPVGMMTGRKLTALTGDFAGCQILLEKAGVQATPLPPRTGAGVCGYEDGVRLGNDGTRLIRYSPPAAASCSVVATLAVWEWQVVQPAAAGLLGSPVERIDTFGTYSCRRIGGGREGGWSEHSTADAIDIAGFSLADGRRITVAGDWSGDDAEARFLRAVRDGACRLFATTLSPDYNAAHRDHLHLDQAERGRMGWRGCR